MFQNVCIHDHSCKITNNVRTVTMCAFQLGCLNLLNSFAATILYIHRVGDVMKVLFSQLCYFIRCTVVALLK